jgi:hypothetical protein
MWFAAAAGAIGVLAIAVFVRQSELAVEAEPAPEPAAG